MAKVISTGKTKVKGAEATFLVLGGAANMDKSKISGVTIRLHSKNGAVVAKGLNLVSMLKGYRLSAESETIVNRALRMDGHVNASEIAGFEQALKKTLAEITPDKFTARE